MSDIAEITIRKVSNGLVVSWIGDAGTDEAVARDVDELCNVLREVLGRGAPMGLMLVGAAPADEPAVKTEGPIAGLDIRSCGFCGRKEGWWGVCPEEDCPFSPAEPGTQAQ